MSKSTQAHLSVTLTKNLSLAHKEQKRKQKEYYMGAKLIEIGLNPQQAVYRWSLKTNAT